MSAVAKINEYFVLVHISAETPHPPVQVFSCKFLFKTEGLIARVLSSEKGLHLEFDLNCFKTQLRKFKSAELNGQKRFGSVAIDQNK